jgi:zinc protease
MGYKAVAARDPDRPAIDVALRILAAGDSSRLDHDLVREHEVATSVDADLQWAIDPELLTIYAQARPKRTAAELETRIDAVLADLRSAPVPDDELAKAKRQLQAEMVRGLKTVSGKANQLGFMDAVLGDYHALFGLEAAWNAVTADDVRRIVARYLDPGRRTVVVLEPLEGGAPAPAPRKKR